MIFRETEWRVILKMLTFTPMKIIYLFIAMALISCTPREYREESMGLDGRQNHHDPGAMGLLFPTRGRGGDRCHFTGMPRGLPRRCWKRYLRTRQQRPPRKPRPLQLPHPRVALHPRATLFRRLLLPPLLSGTMRPFTSSRRRCLRAKVWY